MCVVAISFRPALLKAQDSVAGGSNSTPAGSSQTGTPSATMGSSQSGTPPATMNTSVNPPGGTFYLQNPLSSQFNTVGGIVGGFIQIFVYLVVLFAVLMIIYVGLRLVLVQGDAAEISKLQTQLLWLVIGLAIVIGARIIVQVVINTLSATGAVNQTVIQSAQNANKI